MEYIPYGEVFVEERNNSFSTNYLFNAKELDNETGLYYYGARYLDPTGAMWLSVDPMWEKNIDANPYNYCHGNPITMVDPDGNIPIPVIVWGISEIGLTIYDYYDSYNTISDKNSSAFEKSAFAGGLLLGMILPGGGYGKGAKEGAKAVAKGVDKFSDTKKVANSTKQASTPGRRGAFRQAKKDAGKRQNVQPIPQNNKLGKNKQFDLVKMTDSNGNVIMDKNGKEVWTREYHYPREDGSEVIIQEHSFGHPNFGGKANQPLFNVRPVEKPRNGKVPGTKNHYPFHK